MRVFRRSAFGLEVAPIRPPTCSDDVACGDITITSASEAACRCGSLSIDAGPGGWKASGFSGRDRTHMPQAYFSNHAFEARSGHDARRGAAEILIDHFDVAPAQAAQSIRMAYCSF